VRFRNPSRANVHYGAFNVKLIKVWYFTYVMLNNAWPYKDSFITKSILFHGLMKYSNKTFTKARDKMCREPCLNLRRLLRIHKFVSEQRGMEKKGRLIAVSLVAVDSCNENQE